LLMKMAFRSNLFFMTPIDAGLLALHMKAGWLHVIYVGRII
jgi:hypothetical protein